MAAEKFDVLSLVRTPKRRKRCEVLALHLFYGIRNCSNAIKGESENGSLCRGKRGN